MYFLRPRWVGKVLQSVGVTNQAFTWVGGPVLLTKPLPVNWFPLGYSYRDLEKMVTISLSEKKGDYNDSYSTTPAERVVHLC